MDAKIVKRLSNKAIVKRRLKAGQGGQALFGFSDELMQQYYQKAHHFLELKEAQKAIDCFVFLVTLTPIHSEYWMGLGAALQMAHDYEAAIDAYEMAAIYNLEHPLPYIYLAKCLFAIHDRAASLLSLELAIEYANDHEEFEQFRLEAENMKSHLLEAF